MRILFWLSAILSFLAYSFAIALLLGLKISNNSEPGMAMMLFIPLLGAGIIGGLAANLIRRFKAEQMGRNENAAGIILSMMTGIAAIVVILGYVGVI